VTDTVTGLVWLKNADCFGLENWADANNAAAGLADSACGLTDSSSPGDWRLPTDAEWRATVAQAVALGCEFPALTDTEGTGCFSTGTQPFTGVQGHGYWSSTTNADDPDHAWVLGLFGGYVDDLNKAGTIYVWLVRGGQ
jgi:hypothetical protein